MASVTPSPSLPRSEMQPLVGSAGHQQFGQYGRESPSNAGHWYVVAASPKFCSSAASRRDLRSSALPLLAVALALFDAPAGSVLFAAGSSGACGALAAADLLAAVALLAAAVLPREGLLADAAVTGGLGLYAAAHATLLAGPDHSDCAILIGPMAALMALSAAGIHSGAQAAFAFVAGVVAPLASRTWNPSLAVAVSFSLCLGIVSERQNVATYLELEEAVAAQNLAEQETAAAGRVAWELEAQKDAMQQELAQMARLEATKPITGQARPPTGTNSPAGAGVSRTSVDGGRNSPAAGTNSPASTAGADGRNSPNAPPVGIRISSGSSLRRSWSQHSAASSLGLSNSNASSAAASPLEFVGAQHRSSPIGSPFDVTSVATPVSAGAASLSQARMPCNIMVAGHTRPDGAPALPNLENQLQELARTRATESVDATVQAGTGGVALTSNASTETMITPEKEAFICRRCGLPPSLPRGHSKDLMALPRSSGPPSERSGSSRSSRRSKSSRRSRGSSDVGGGAGDGGWAAAAEAGATPMVSAFALTQAMSFNLSLEWAMKHWNLPRVQGTCCPFHAYLFVARQVLKFEASSECSPLWSALTGWQCHQCSCLNHEERTVCDMCCETREVYLGSTESRLTESRDKSMESSIGSFAEASH